MYDSIGTTTYCMIICMKSRLMSFSYDSVTEGCISVKCQLLTVNFVGFGCQPGFRLHTSRQSFEPSYTRIQALLVFFFSIALSKKDSRFYPVPGYTQFKPTSTSPRSAVLILSPLFLLIASLKSWSAQGPLKWIVSGSTRVILSIKY